MNDVKFSHEKECEAYDFIKNIKNFPKAEIYYIEKTSELSPGVSWWRFKIFILSK